MEVRVMKNILGENDATADANAAFFAQHKIFVLNLMGSPGAGKTSLLERTLSLLKDEFSIAVIEGDLFTDKDAERIDRCGVPVVQINTAGGCHLDANMIKNALGDLPLDELDMIIVENVGNLVCPAEFNLGESAKAVVLSVTEGADKPMKYPLMFKESAVAILNKIDLLPYVDFDRAVAERDIERLNPGIKIIGMSATKADDEGAKVWCDWLRDEIREAKA